MDVLGFTITDAARFASLDDARVIEWHRNGWLALVHYHLASLQRFNDLLLCQGKRGATPSLLQEVKLPPPKAPPSHIERPVRPEWDFGPTLPPGHKKPGRFLDRALFMVAGTRFELVTFRL